MLSIYSSYKCKTCEKEFALLTEDIENMLPGRYLTCPYCNSKRVNKEKVSDVLKECMMERVYRRENGALDR